MATRRSTSNGQTAALSHLRVVELGDMAAAYSANYLGGLGADVAKVEPPGGDPNRWLPPFAKDTPGPERSLTFLNANLNKRSIVLDVRDAKDRGTIEALLARADIFLEATPVGYLTSLGLGEQRLKEINPGLVTVSMTPFGQNGPYSGFKGNDPIVAAMSGVMGSQGDDTKPPAVPPGQIASQLAAILGAYLALAGVRHRRKTGVGQRIDLSLQEAITYAAVGAIARYSQRSDIQVRQGTKGGASNIYRCKDGQYVNLSIFMTGHWRILTREWMEDPVLSAPEWDSSQYRTDNQDVIYALLSEFIGRFDGDEFVNECQKRGLTCAPVNTIDQFVQSEHMVQRGWFQEVDHPVVGRYRAPGAPFIMSLTPYHITRRAPLLDEHRKEILAEVQQPLPKREAAQAVSSDKATAPMLDDIRVADITRAFVGPISTMFLGFYGAEVIKVESESLEANREPTSPIYPDMNRNKLSCTIDLRSAGGKDLLRRLVTKSDILVENFSATVMRRLGFGFEEVQKIRPGLIQIGMPGMGSTGPLNWWVTYGNSLQAYTGLTHLWGYPDSPMQAHGKGVIPDYAGAAFMALASTAALEYRDQTGQGQFIEICQVDGQGYLLGPAILDFTVNGRVQDSVGNRDPVTEPLAPFGTYPCRYADTWIVISCASDEEWRSLVKAMGEPTWAQDPRFATHAGRHANRDEIDARLADWTQAFTPHQAMRLLQKAGVTAGVAMNGEQLYHDPHLRARGHLIEIDEPPWGRPLAHQGLPGIPSLSRASAGKPTPWIGVDNDYVFKQVLGLSGAEIEEWKKAGSIR